MVTVPGLKLVSGEPCIELCLQSFQQFVDRKDGIIHLVTGVNGRDFFVPDQQERIRRIQLQAFVEHSPNTSRLSLGSAVPPIFALSSRLL